MRKRFIAGNWKMFNGQKATCDFFNKFKVVITNDQQVMRAITDKEVLVAIFPPMISIPCAHKCKGDMAIIVGAQNCHFEKNGAFTGEISTQMLSEAGCTHVIIGHSERRHIFGETDAVLNKKVLSALEEGLTPIFCVGELLEEREGGKTFEVIERQVTLGLESVAADILSDSKVIIAYEPVWAIGTGRTAGGEDAQEVCSFIRKKIACKYGESAAQKILILYGGSVKPDNTKALLSQADIDGVLVGGASLKYDSFYDIVKESI